MIYTHCPQFMNTPCRFCSQESLIIPYAPLIEDPRSKRLIAGSVVHRKESLGTLCNQLSMFTKDVHQCPARLALAFQPWTGIKAEGTGIYAKLYTEAELREILREDPPITLGQQVLCV